MEPVFGFSRAVVSGRNVHVAGTAPIPREGEPPDGAYEQMRLCLDLVVLGESDRQVEIDEEVLEDAPGSRHAAQQATPR